MNLAQVERIVAAVLYEGYILYPYRANAVKNRHRFQFGTLHPQASCPATGSAERWSMRTECLIVGAQPIVEIRVRFLHSLAREVRRVPPRPASRTGALSAAGELLETLTVGDRIYQTWQEAVEREIAESNIYLCAIEGAPRQREFVFPALELFEPIDDDSHTVGVLVRRQRAVTGMVDVTAERLGERLWKLGVTISNLSAPAGTGLLEGDEALLETMASTHTILGASAGQFVSAFDPPEELGEAAAGCCNSGCWPVLVGDESARDMLLSSPITLYDFPQVAADSAGDFFDLTEIDEMLSLRVLTLTDDEKRLMRSVDERTRRILERTEALAEERLRALPGTVPDIRPFGKSRLGELPMNDQGWEQLEGRPRLESLRIDGNDLRPGDKVRLRPQNQADIIDMALQGKIATIESIEQDYENNIHLAVVVDDDPGRDLGMLRQPGHRFFFPFPKSNRSSIPTGTRCHDGTSPNSHRRHRQYFFRRRRLRDGPRPAPLAARVARGSAGHRLRHSRHRFDLCPFGGLRRGDSDRCRFPR